MNLEEQTKLAIHQLNSQAFQLNKNIAPNEGLKPVSLHQDIYNEQPQEQQPQPQVQQQPLVQQQPQVQQIIQQDLTPLIDRVTALEKQVTKFVNLIERNVAKNAKEINIRIKLNENNDSTDKQ